MNNDDVKDTAVRDFAGKNNFIWWIGTVEDRKDPLKLGRCRVRCFGWHTEDKTKIPTEALPWAVSAFPNNEQDPYGIWEANMVFGFFADAQNAQEPVIVGILPNIPLTKGSPDVGFFDPRKDDELKKAPRHPKHKIYDETGPGIKIIEKDKADRHPRRLDEPTTPRLARNDPEHVPQWVSERKIARTTKVPTAESARGWDEPVQPYNPTYPYNRVMKTESGHILEFDDTFGNERVQLAHRNGSFQEMFPNGDKVEKVTRDNYEIIMKDDHVFVMGKCKVTVQGDVELYFQQDVSIKIDGNVKVRVKGNYDEYVEGNYKIESSGDMVLIAPIIHLNP